MRIKKMVVFLFIILSVKSFSTKWNYGGGLDGEAGLMLIYKTLPPLLVEVEEPETMSIASGNQSFKYSEVSRSKKPLNVKIEVYFNNTIVQDNSINKSIISTIYDSVRLSFINNGSFFLYKESDGIEPRDIKKTLDLIDGEVFFTDANGIEEATNKAKIVYRKLGETIQDGVLRRDDIYIDAIFNRKQEELIVGKYRGGTTLMVEFLGKGALN